MKSRKPKPTTRLNKLRKLYTSAGKVRQALYDADGALDELDGVTVFIEQEMAR
jgi:hypothetical protein